MYADDMVICNQRVEGKSIEVEACNGKEGNEGQLQWGGIHVCEWEEPQLPLTEIKKKM